MGRPKSFHNNELNSYLNVCSDFLLLQTLSEWPRTLRCPKWMNAKCCFTWCCPDLHWEVVDGMLGKGDVIKCWPWEAYHTVGASSLYLQPLILICETTYKLFCLGESVFNEFWNSAILWPSAFWSSGHSMSCFKELFLRRKVEGCYAWVLEWHLFHTFCVCLFACIHIHAYIYVFSELSDSWLGSIYKTRKNKTCLMTFIQEETERGKRTIFDLWPLHRCLEPELFRLYRVCVGMWWNTDNCRYCSGTWGQIAFGELCVCERVCWQSSKYLILGGRYNTVWKTVKSGNIFECLHFFFSFQRYKDIKYLSNQGKPD